MEHNSLTYRFIGEKEKDQYLNFISRFENKSKDFDPYYFSSILDNVKEHYVETCNDGDHYRHVGAFKGDDLVLTISGHFPENTAWYMYNQFSTIQSESLASAIDVHVSTIKANMLLTEWGESLAIFNFYQRRSIKSQRQIDTILKRIKGKDYVRERYDIYHDAYYPPDEGTFRPNHKFFPALRGIGSLVTLYSLNQTERIKILSKHFDSYKTWYPTPDSNGEHTPFERAASTNCASGANMAPPEGFEPS